MPRTRLYAAAVIKAQAVAYAQDTGRTRLGLRFFVSGDADKRSAMEMIESGMFGDGPPSLDDLVGSTYTDGQIVGSLLNKPFSDFGVHSDDEVIVKPYLAGR